MKMGIHCVEYCLSHALFGTNRSNPRSALMYIFSLYYGNVYYANIVEICPYYKFKCLLSIIFYSEF